MPGSSARAPVDHGNHAVQLYGDDDELAASVGRFLGEGLEGGEAALVVATPAHRAGIALPSTERVLMVDAARTLLSFLDGDHLDTDRFNATAADLIEQAAGTPPRPVRIYAEMVAVLWDAGNVTLALELEGLWNDLAARMPFTLLCAYPAKLVAEHDDPSEVAAVRRLHGDVLGVHPEASAPVSSGRAGRGFPAHLDSARRARHYVLRLLRSRLDPSVAADASIIIAELAANAVLHARSAFRVTVSEWDGFVRISVADAAPLPDGGFVALPGHGLDVVSKVAVRWAVEPLPDGKVVWAEVPARA